MVEDKLLKEILEKSVEKKASDVHLKPGNYPVFRLDGELCRQTEFPLIKADQTLKWVENMVYPKKRLELEEKGSVDFGWGVPGVGRFRVNVYLQRGTYAIAMRYIPFEVPEFDTLNLPPVIRDLALERNGLILVTGVTGSGKSTTLAAMLQHINRNRAANIITIEDPIEYLLKDDKSIISQRELGDDFSDFLTALRAALRQDPDVIMVGEMRDLETIKTALLAAETGHLVFSTLHTLDAPETVNRIISVFPPNEQEEIRVQLSSVLRAIISMKLLPKIGGGRVPACEIMINTPAIRECILNIEKFHDMKPLIEQGKAVYGTQTFDQSLYDLYVNGLISYEEAVANATNPDDFKLKVKGILSSAEMAMMEFFSKEEEESEKKPKEKVDIKKHLLE
ncbi:MAG: type IV pilus twitching motility protein PilT [Deferribacteres bacterium]|nr:type IV pilus twitching motility protein PilT [Deferribacteres bacterium]